jgi:hypothetical protein
VACLPFVTSARGDTFCLVANEFDYTFYIHDFPVCLSEFSTEPWSRESAYYS